LIESLERQTSRLSKAKDEAFGASRIALIDQETSALERELEAQKNLYRVVSEYLEQDKEALGQYGVQFDNLGNISNHEEVTRKYFEMWKSGAISDE